MGIQEGRAFEQILRRVAAQRQLGEDDQIAAGLLGPVDPDEEMRKVSLEGANKRICLDKGNLQGTSTWHGGHGYNGVI
jgi:hypothetical protein